MSNSILRCPNCGSSLVRRGEKQYCNDCGYIVNDVNAAAFDDIQNKQTEDSVGVPKTE